MTKSHIPPTNAPTQIGVPEGQLANESQIHLKRGRPIDSKDLAPQKMRTQRKISTHEEANIKQKAPVEANNNKRPQQRHMMNKKAL